MIVDDMSSRVDQLEKSIGDLMQEADTQEPEKK